MSNFNTLLLLFGLPVICCIIYKFACRLRIRRPQRTIVSKIGKIYKILIYCNFLVRLDEL